MSRAASILTRLFGEPEEINGHERCPTYLFRWKVWSGRDGRAAYVHRFVADDWSLDFHDHPKRFLSIGLWGSYAEERPGPVASQPRRKFYRAPWVRTFPAHHVHRLILISRVCWTLVVVLRTERPWGFVTPDGRWIDWRAYVEPGSEARAACGGDS
jgi:hypothetical protein